MQPDSLHRSEWAHMFFSAHRYPQLKPLLLLEHYQSAEPDVQNIIHVIFTQSGLLTRLIEMPGLNFLYAIMTASTAIASLIL